MGAHVRCGQRPWQYLYFFPDPHGHAWFLPTLPCGLPFAPWPLPLPSARRVPSDEDSTMLRTIGLLTSGVDTRVPVARARAPLASAAAGRAGGTCAPSTAPPGRSARGDGGAVASAAPAVGAGTAGSDSGGGPGAAGSVSLGSTRRIWTLSSALTISRWMSSVRSWNAVKA